MTNETENNKRKFSNTMESSLVALNETNENGDSDKTNYINNIDLDLKNSVSIVATGEESSIKNDKSAKVIKKLIIVDKNKGHILKLN